MFMFFTKSTSLLNKEKNYFKLDMSNDFPIKHYILENYSVSPSYFYPDNNFSEDVLDFLFNNSSLMNFSVNGDIKEVVEDKKKFRSGFFFFHYKNVYIKVSVKNEVDDDGLKLSYESFS